MGLRNHSAYSDSFLQFVTTKCNNWCPVFSKPMYFDILKDTMAFCQKKYDVALPAYVFMPNHIHMLLNFQSDFRLSDFMRDFKKYTSYRIIEDIKSEKNTLLLDTLGYVSRKQRHKLWADRFDSVMLDEPVLSLQKMNYIHQNPVKKKFVEKPEDYKYSSAGFYKGKSELYMPVNDLFEVMGWDEYTLYF